MNSTSHGKSDLFQLGLGPVSCVVQIRYRSDVFKSGVGLDQSLTILQKYLTEIVLNDIVIAIFAILEVKAHNYSHFH